MTELKRRILFPSLSAICSALFLLNNVLTCIHHFSLHQATNGWRYECLSEVLGTDPLLGYAEVLGWYRYGRRTMPPPHPGLTREQAVLYRQLQTRSVLTPALARYVCPEVFESEVCSVCKRAKATLTHILWDCDLHPEEAVASPGRLPEDIARAVLSQDLTEQLQAVQRLEVALARQSRGAEPAGDRGYKSHRSTAGRPSGSRGGNTPKTP